jgi:hypothetical protein
MTTMSERLFEDELRPVLAKHMDVKVGGIAKSVVKVYSELEHPPNKALDRAMARGLFLRESAKKEEGGSISADEAARRLGISKTSVLKRYKKGQLLGWREAKQKSVRFPVWQFSKDGILTGLSEVLSILSKSTIGVASCSSSIHGIASKGSALWTHSAKAMFRSWNA